MIKEISLKGNTLQLSHENGNVRVLYGSENIILFDQTIENTEKIILDNFQMVNDFYTIKALSFTNVNVYLHDINQLSLEIVLFYLYMYNSWRIQYKKNSNISLEFKEQDFKNPTTLDIIIRYFKKRIENFTEISGLLAGMSKSEFEQYYKERDKYYNR